MKSNSFQYRLISGNADQLLVKFSKDKLKQVTSRQNSEYKFEVINQGKLGFASFNQPDLNLLKKQALESSQFGDKVSYLYPKTVKPKNNVKLFSQKVADIKPELLIKIGANLIDAIKQVNKDILVDVYLDKSVRQAKLDTSAGLKYQQKASDFGIYADGQLVQEGDILSIDESFVWGDFNFDERAFQERLINKFKLAKKITPIKSGSYTVVFGKEVLVGLFEFVETALSASSVYKKVSKWQNQIGQQVTDNRLSLRDDPKIDFAIGSNDIDDEGLPCQSLTLIEGGVLKDFYTDLKNAQKLKITPNGRGFGIPANPNLTNVIVEPGKLLSEKIIKGIKKGILIEQVIGGGQDSPYSGDFALNIHLGFLIENGEIIGRVKNCMVSGNIFEMLKLQIQEISSDTQWHSGSMKLPTISFEKVNITSQ